MPKKVERNILSLWEAAVKTPPYPSYLLVKGQDGILLRDPDMKFVLDVSDNLKYRYMVRQKAEENPSYREYQRIFCKSSILYFCNVFCWTYDPRLESPHIPFVTFPFQDDVLTWCLWLIKNHETGLIEKSRDMGLTWMMEVVAAYMTLFFPGMVDYQMSLREDDVDNRTEDSLLGKYRYILRSLPEWMQGGWVEGQQQVDQKMLIKVPQTDSMVRGQLTMGTSGRSGRATRVFNDEFAFIEDAFRVLKAISALAPSQIYGSTPNGMGNAFYLMAHTNGVKKKTLHWSLHPLKNREWARKERSKITYTDETWAQEHEVSYEVSTIGRVYPEFISFSKSQYEWSHIQDGDYTDFDPLYDVYCSMDMGFGDPTSVIWAQLKPPPRHFLGMAKACLLLFDEEEAPNKDVDYWRNVLTGVAGVPNDGQRRAYKYREIIGDYRTAQQRTQASQGRTWIQMLGRIQGLTLSGKRSSESGPILNVKRLLQNPRDGVKDGILLACSRSGTPNLIKAFQNWSFQIDKETRTISAGAKPLHNQWSHSMKALAYLVDYSFDAEKERPKAPIQGWEFRIKNLETRV